MIDHLSTYASDFDATKAFYDAALSTLGYQCNVEMVTSWDQEHPDRRICAYGPGQRPIYWVVEIKDGSTVTPRHVAFAAKSKDEVDAFYNVGLEAGGKDNGAPGPREHYHPGYYGGFLLDPDENNVEAVFHGAG